MSINTFKRYFEQAGNSNHDPPGIESNVTPKVYFDLENKRLYNVNKAREQSGAVNLNLFNEYFNRKFE